LIGENGVGKTSVLQAIEWGLLGEIAFLEGDEFNREDATVNLFSEDGKASVKLRIKDENGTNFEVFRERKKLSKTRGKSSLFLSVNREIYKARNAEIKLREFLKISPEEYNTTVHLHQEVIRELVEGSEETRNKAINKILGIDLLSDFGEIIGKQLHSSSVINRSLRGLQKVVEQLGVERKTINDAKIAEERAMENIKNRLIERGVDLKETERTINPLVSEIREVMGNAAKELSAGELISCISRLQFPADKADEMEKNLDDIKDIKRRLSFVTQNRMNKVQNEIVELELLEKQHTSYLNQLEELKVKDKAEIAGQLKEVEAKISDLETELARLRAKNNQLKDLKDDVGRILVRIHELSDEADGIIKNYGDESVIEQKRHMLNEQANNFKQNLERLGTYNNLLNLAMKYIEATREEICPVCSRPIECETLLSSIRQKISEELIKRMEEHTQLIEKVKEDEEKLAEAARELKRVKKSLKDCMSELDEVKEDYRKITGLELTEPFLSSLENQICTSEKGIAECEQQNEGFKKRLTELKHACSIVENLDSIESKIREMLRISGGGAELLKALSIYANSKKEELEKLRLLYERLENLVEKINILEDIITFFRRSASSKLLDKSIEEVDKKLFIQQEKLQKLSELLEALTDIRDATNSVKMGALEDILSIIRDDLNALFSRLIGHPFFVKLQLVPDEKGGKHIYRLMAESGDKRYITYVRTRFSQTQRNIVAISLFLAMAKHSPAKLVIMDDPSQSLDLEHKKAFVEVLRTIINKTQVIVATQDEDLAYQMLKSVPNEKLSAYRLAEWTENGPMIEKIQ
jgi:DNA repair exonuclease SbcCD ATPase subunit